MKSLLSLLILFTPLTIFSQENPAPRTEAVKTQVQQLLQSPKDAEQAWAAYLVGKYKLSEFLSALTAKLDQLAMHSVPEHRLLNAIMDALIQLDAEVVAEQLLPFYARFPNQVMILLSKSPERNQKELLTLLEQPNLETKWFVICNALARTKAPGFAKVLLRDLEIKANVFVTSNPNQGYGFGGGSGCGVSACGVLAYRPLSDFPPLVFYNLTRHAARGVVAFSPGKYPVFYYRSEEGSERNEHGSSSECFTGQQLNQYRIEYLSELLNITTEQMDFKLERSFTVLWKGALNYKLRLTGIRREVDQSFNLFARRFQEAELLTNTEWAELTPKVSITIHDHRADATTTLPE